MPPVVNFKKFKKAVLFLRPFVGKRLSKERMKQVAMQTGIDPSLVREIDRRINSRWLVHKTKRDFLRQILSSGLIPAHAPTRNPQWFVVNQIFDSVKPRGIKMARTRANYFATREFVEHQLANESFLLSSDFRGWFSKKDVESIDFTRIRARVDARKLMVFDEAKVDAALQLFRGFHEKTGTQIVMVQQVPKDLAKAIKVIAMDYWRTAISFQELESFYSFDPKRSRIVKKPNAPASLPKIIERSEILYPSKVARNDLREIRDMRDEQLKELRREFGIEK